MATANIRACGANRRHCGSRAKTPRRKNMATVTHAMPMNPVRSWIIPCHEVRPASESAIESELKNPLTDGGDAGDVHQPHGGSDASSG